MAVSDQLQTGGLVDLPAQAGDVNAPCFHPNETWLRSAPVAEQKAALWRWFATRFDDPEEATPHDEQGHYLFGNGEPVLADQVLTQRFQGLVSDKVIGDVIAAVCQEVGNKWALKRMDKAGA